MNYIVFDLEWNQCPYGKEKENRKLPFEIIEIGAVRMNENMEILDTFHQYIRPKVYRKIHYRIQEVIGGITMEMLKKEGKPFPEAVYEFKKFCGEDFRFCIWGTLDISELLRNLKFYHMEDELEAPLLYEDVQKLFALTYETKAERRSLAYAADYLKLPGDGDFHHALDDAMYTAKVLATIPREITEGNYSVDYFKLPDNNSKAWHIRYQDYEKMISRPFSSREKLASDREILSIHCFVCGKTLRKKIRWFPLSSHVQEAVGICPEHGYVQCKIRVKKTLNGKAFAVKTTKLIGEEKLGLIREKKDAMKIRHKKSKE